MAVRDASRPMKSARANSRSALLDAAFEEFSTKGYEDATVAGIAARAGVTTGALYAHFSGKLDLLLSSIGLTPVDEVLRSAGELASLPWSEASKLVIEGLAARPDPRMLLLLDVVVVARRNPEVASHLRHGLEIYLKAMTRANDAGVSLGLFDPAIGTEDLARLFGLLTFGMVVFSALEESPPSEAAFARLADLLLQAGDPDDERDRPAALSRVRARATAADRARRALDDSIVDAVREGHSLRQVGTAAGLSHERVRQVLRERQRS